MNGRAERGRRLRYTWGDVVLTVLPLITILYAAILAGNLSDWAERRAERTFWLAWLTGASIAGAVWIWYARHPQRLREDPQRRDRSRKLIVAVAPALITGLALAEFAPDLLRFGVLGAGSGFI